MGTTANLATLVRLCEQVTDGTITHDDARQTLAERHNVAVTDLTPEFNWARSHFDPDRHLVDLTWSHGTQLEASIMAHELHAQRVAAKAARYGKRAS